MTAGGEPALLTQLNAWAAALPGRAVLRDFGVAGSRAQGSAHQRAALSGGDVREMVGRLAAGLRRGGIGPGEIVAVQLPNWHEYLITHLALYAVGAVTLPISPIYRSLDVRRQLQLSGSRTLIVPGTHKRRDYAQEAVQLLAEVPTLDRLIVVGATAPDGARRWADVLESGGATELADERRAIMRGDHVRGPDELLLLNFTSGTTGEPKGVMHSHRTLAAGLGAIARRLRLTGDDVFLVPSTLGHAAGFINGMYLPLFLGAQVVYLDDWDPRFALEVMELSRVSYTAAMPTYLMDLVRHNGCEARNISNLRTVRISGGPISRSAMAELGRALPDARLCPGWGMTECLYVTSASPDDDADRRDSTDGYPFDGCQVQVRDPSCTRALPDGQVGELVVRTPSRTIGYFGRPDLTAAALTEDGWFKTGDMGRIDDGHVRISGRAKDLVIRGGENIPAVAVEQLLADHPKVRRAAVIGVPDARLGERACAVVECRDADDPLTFAELTDFFTGRGATRHFTPEFLVVVASLPLTPTGKIRKHELVATYGGLGGAATESAVAKPGLPVADAAEKQGADRD